jgi:hypothetical protein
MHTRKVGTSLCSRFLVMTSLVVCAGAVEQVQEAYRQIEVANKELESHRSKRIAARNEMIVVAQVLVRNMSDMIALELNRLVAML